MQVVTSVGENSSVVGSAFAEGLGVQPMTQLDSYSE